MQAVWERGRTAIGDKLTRLYSSLSNAYQRPAGRWALGIYFRTQETSQCLRSAHTGFSAVDWDRWVTSMPRSLTNGVLVSY
ncbi:hypothetical protein EV356DRAFT_221923 [Viridothelium virens]|uniref:Uncharacterized protein n=1 Tax=Viridothelium virens TaxID=1048519 RepID=A0A6A6HL55_VIRVR|nr:hypothetical protein EV356DRAFT_221923 [Viridothelium virens]